MSDSSLRWRIPFIIGLTLVGAFVVWYGARHPENGLKLGFDLKGGVELTYRVEGALTPEMAAKMTPDQIKKYKESVAGRTEEVIKVVSKRLDPTGVKAPDIRSESTGEIIIRLPGLTVEEVASIQRRAEQMGRLEFRIVVSPDEYAKMSSEQKAGVKKMLMPEKHRGGANLPGDCVTYTPVYILMHDKYEVTGEMLNRAYPTSDEMGMPAVGFTFNSEGARRFGEMTGALAGKGSIAIILNDTLKSAPNVKSRITSSGIIEGSYTQDEVNEMVTVLQAGSLPASLTLQSKTFVGPELGADSYDRGFHSCELSLLIVVAFMLCYYLVAGAIADLALTLNLLFLIAAMMLTGAVLTLPGIAGIVLTLGMAVDANILIYERVREEQAQGQSLRIAVKNGYARAFWTIFDSHVTTLISGIVLYWLGTGSVRGFAVTLCIGIILSLFTALFVTRIVFDVLISKGWLKDRVVMLHIFRKPPSVRWIRLAPVFFIVSGIAITLGMIVFFYRGRENYGIDFSSGTEMHLRLKGIEAKPSEPTAEAGGKSRFTMAFYHRQPGGLVPVEATETVVREGIQRLVDWKDPKDPIPPIAIKDVSKDVTLTWPAGKKDSGTGVTVTVVEPKGGSAVAQALVAGIEKAGFKVFRDRMDIEAVRKMVTAAGYPTANVQTSFGNEAAVGRHDSDQFTFRISGKSDNETQEQREAVPTDIENGFRDVVDFKSVKTDVLTDDDAAKKMCHVTLTFRDPVDNGLLGLRQVHVERSLEHLNIRLPDGKFLPGVKVDFPSERKYFETITIDVPLDRKADIEKKLVVKDAFAFPDAFTGYYFVNPGQARSIAWSAVWAALLSFLGICVYVWLRFGGFKYGLGAVVSLVHDVLYTLGFLACMAWLAETQFGEKLGIGDVRLSLDVVAGVLTLIGYSINDTIVVFDRIRENLRKRAREMRGKRQIGNILTPELIDRSINQTMARTVLTSFTVWIVCVTLYFGAGMTLRGMSLALIFGVAVGTFSSFAIACPILVMTYMREERKAHAKGELTAIEQEVAEEAEKPEEEA